MGIGTKLAQLEKAVKTQKVGTCKLCYGHPVSLTHEAWEVDPDGPGLRRVGPRTLDAGFKDRLTDDGQRCRRCDAPVRSTMVLEDLRLEPVLKRCEL